VAYSDIVTTTTHKTLRGPRSGVIMCRKEHAEAVDKAVFPGLQGGPLEHIIAAKAVAFGEALRPEFKEYQKSIISNSKALAGAMIESGFRITSGGTDNHLMLVDVTSKGVTGKEMQDILQAADIIVNKNMIPFDTRKPFDPSGVRIGTPAVTTRGMGKKEMEAIAGMISESVAKKQGSALEEIKREVAKICSEFPVYPELEY
jgi:glycine hydroxymethyltransferase